MVCNISYPNWKVLFPNIEEKQIMNIFFKRVCHVFCVLLKKYRSTHFLKSTLFENPTNTKYMKLKVL